MLKTATCLICLGCFATIGALADDKQPADVRFVENFEDASLESRQWYDMSSIKIAGDAAAGTGCIEYEWVDSQPNTQGSSAMRRLFEPSDQIYLRFYLKLSKGWGWSGRN